MKITEPGIFYDMAPEVYYGDPAPLPSLTQSIAKILIEQSPAHARLAHPRLCPPVAEDADPEKYDAAKAIGNAAHAALIGRGKRVIEGDYPDWRKAEARLLRDTAVQNGDIPILKKHADRAREMIKRASHKLEAEGCGDAFRNGKGEVVVAWQEDRIWLRTMIDWMGSATRLWDYKTTGLLISDRALPKLIYDAGWHIQAAMHERALDAIYPDSAGRRHFHFALQENDEPYALRVIEIDEPWLTIGRKDLEIAVQRWTHCITRNEWPEYPSGIVRPPLPGWLEAQVLERELEHRDRRRYPGPILTDLAGG